MAVIYFQRRIAVDYKSSALLHKNMGGNNNGKAKVHGKQNISH